MSFKFSLLNLERDNCNCDNYKKSKNKKSSSSQQEKFKEAVQKCHSKTKNKDSFGKCMSKELKS